jgi:hypothetical protein
MTIDHTVTIDPLPNSHLLLAVHYIRNPYGAAEELLEIGPMTGYYYEVLNQRRDSLSTLSGPYETAADATAAALRQHRAATPVTYAGAQVHGETAVWAHIDRYEEESCLPFEPSMRTARYLLLRDLVAVMEAAGDDIAETLAEALDDVAALKGVSTAGETPATPANPLPDKDLPF